MQSLRTERLALRPFALADVDVLHALWMDPDVRRYLWDDEAITRERAESTVRDAVEAAAREGVGMWIVEERSTGRMAGFCGLVRREAGADLELLYGLAPAFWHRGYATEASRAVIDYAFTALAAPRVTAATDPPNAASVRVMERLGFRFIRRGALNGLDTLFYELNREDRPTGPPGRDRR